MKYPPVAMRGDELFDMLLDEVRESFRVDTLSAVFGNPPCKFGCLDWWVVSWPKTVKEQRFDNHAFYSYAGSEVHARSLAGQSVETDYLLTLEEQER